jgi:hypothetical protein
MKGGIWENTYAHICVCIFKHGLLHVIILLHICSQHKESLHKTHICTTICLAFPFTSSKDSSSHRSCCSASTKAPLPSLYSWEFNTIYTSGPTLLYTHNIYIERESERERWVCLCEHAFQKQLREVSARERERERERRKKKQCGNAYVTTCFLRYNSLLSLLKHIMDTSN